ncbi:MAG: hypothetical protein II075_03335 [Bacteroidales bacterium]|nr:hypothetical protein [Bacteroidales bacterium]
MNNLDINRINNDSPYDVSYNTNGAYLFVSDYGVRYAVTFDDGENPFFTAYWFNLTNLENKTSPGDKKVAQTIICIIEEFFRKNPDILLYMCSTEGGLQAQRARLFLRWFNGAKQREQYVIRTNEVRGENRNEYVAMIVQRNNPLLDDIIRRYESDVAMFNELKP